MNFPKTPRDDQSINQRLKELKKKMSGDGYNGVLDDLVVFTGLTEEEVLFRILKKEHGVWGAKGWFDDEWDWHNPSSDGEIDWFYRCSQSYLFTNARHPYWDKIGLLKDCAQILDFGGGVGMNTMELLRRGHAVIYYEKGILQREFFRSRSFDGDLTIIRSLSSFDSFTVDGIIFQDVLEHIPEYHITLSIVLSSLRKGGIVLERSPFRPPGHKPNKRLQMHLEASMPLRKAMAKNGMKLMKRCQENTNLWVKG